MIITKIKINKNRGWRGLASVEAINEHTHTTILRMIFSFSEKVWRDMLEGTIVMQDKYNYYVINFDNIMSLPSPTQQRSVLIKNFEGNVINVNSYKKNERLTAKEEDYKAIDNFLHNKNNHTQSDWNCIGIRVIPEI